MKITDIIALAKMGYSPAEVKDLLSMGDESPQPTDNEPEVQKTEPKESPKDTPEPEEAEAINYKELYLSAKKELESARDQLKEAQTLNTTAVNIPAPQDTDSDILSELVRDFM